MVPKMVLPLYSCGFQHYTIFNPTGIFHAMVAPGPKSGDVLASLSH
jgi:hypothetical protein